jgi:hypothetical protein
MTSCSRPAPLVASAQPGGETGVWFSSPAQAPDVQLHVRGVVVLHGVPQTLRVISAGRPRVDGSQARSATICRWPGSQYGARPRRYGNSRRLRSTSGTLTCHHQYSQWAGRRAAGLCTPITGRLARMNITPTAPATLAGCHDPVVVVTIASDCTRLATGSALTSAYVGSWARPAWSVWFMLQATRDLSWFEEHNWQCVYRRLLI